MRQPYAKVSDDISGSYSKFTLVLCLIRNVSGILFSDDSIRLSTCITDMQNVDTGNSGEMYVLK